MTTEHILIIDDSIAIASLLANEILPLGGYQATAALSGEEGLEIARELKPDLILCDLEMPGINGLDVLRTLQSEGTNTPAIMMTAFGSEAIAAQALRMGVKDYIIKPFTTEEILAAVERAMTERRLRRKLEVMEAKLEEHRKALSVIQAIGHAAGVGVEPKAILSHVILAAVHSGSGRAGFIARHDAQNKQLGIQAVANLPGWEGKQIQIQEKSAVAEALHSGEVARNKDAIGCWVHVPLMHQQNAIGVMSIVGKVENLPAHTNFLLSALAGYAAYTIKNNQLRAELAVATLQVKQTS